MSETPEQERAAAELRRLQLEIAKLENEAGSAPSVRRMELATRLLPALTILLTLLGFGFTVWQYRAEQVAKRMADVNMARQQFMKPLIEKKQELYFEAAAAAATIASTQDPAERKKATNEFWKLYWGPLVMVENTEVSDAMLRFGHCLDAAETCSQGEFQDRSLKLASALETSMLKTWDAKPEDFVNSQFIYR